MITWTKEDGQEVETNELPANIKAAEGLGWTREEVTPDVIKVDARGVPHDERINTKNMSQDDAGNWKYKQGVTPESALPVEEELLAAIAAAK